METQPGSRPESLSAVLRRILDETPDRTIGDVAAAMGVAYATFYGRVAGRAPLNADEITPLLQAVPDPRLLDWLLAGTPFVAIRRSELDGRDTVPRATYHCLNAITSLTAAAHYLFEAEASMPLDDAARADLECRLTEADRALASLSVLLQQESPCLAAAAD
jgi:hypothetical protein